MSQLVIEWDRERLIAVDGISVHSGVQVRGALKIGRSANLDTARLGQELGQALADVNIRTESARIVLPRSLVMLQRIQLPNVPDEELPDMVRLQAATLLSVPADGVHLDFVPLPATGDMRHVVLASVPTETVNDIRNVLAAARLELAGIHVSSFSIAEALSHAGLLAGNRNLEAIIALHSEKIELLVIQDRTVQFSHSGTAWSTPDEMEQTVRSEISRGRLAATENMGRHSITQAMLIGSANALNNLPDDMTKRLDSAPVSRVDPAESVIRGSLPQDLSATDVLAAAGVIAAAHKPTLEHVDLINPRKPAEKKDTRRIKILLTVGVVLLTVTGAWKWRDTQLKHVDEQISRLETKTSTLKQELRAGEDDLEQDAAIQEWSAANIDWLAEMNRIRELMGGTDRLLIRSFDCTAGRGRARGTIQADCLGRDRNDIESFQRRLKTAGYDIVPKTIEAGSRDPDYTMQVALEISIPLEEKDES